AAWVRGSDSGIALFNMGSTPVLATEVSAALAGGASAGDASRHAAAGTQPPRDLSASPEYRTHLATVLTQRALVQSGVK
ncbi:MAG: xanthine dehydrogenase family protein subunit M, partial [Actinomycetota bacterium]